MCERFELLFQALALQRQFSDSVIDQFAVRRCDVVDQRADLLINCAQPRLESDLRLSNLSDLAPKLFIQRRSNAFVSVVIHKRFVERHDRVDNRLFQQFLINAADLTDMSAMPNVVADLPPFYVPAAMRVWTG